MFIPKNLRKTKSMEGKQLTLITTIGFPWFYSWCWQLSNSLLRMEKSLLASPPSFTFQMRKTGTLNKCKCLDLKSIFQWTPSHTGLAWKTPRSCSLDEAGAYWNSHPCPVRSRSLRSYFYRKSLVCPLSGPSSSGWLGWLGDHILDETIKSDNRPSHHTLRTRLYQNWQTRKS